MLHRERQHVDLLTSSASTLNFEKEAQRNKSCAIAPIFNHLPDLPILIACGIRDAFVALTEEAPKETLEIITCESS
jgi:hypothetical protein